ncbi:MAG: metal-dependent transcriptional regulator [Firmicutes bacterium]|nr:metal-dependent transcriptional regulator [Bacillota bacterium]
MKLHESGENYLEAILVLEKRNGIARSVDVANELNFSKPSVSRAVSVLKDAGYVTIGNINQLLLTEKGREVAEKIFERHCLIKEFLLSIGVSEEAAEDDACKIEHAVSDETFECLKTLIENLKNE